MKQNLSQNIHSNTYFLDKFRICETFIIIGRYILYKYYERDQFMYDFMAKKINDRKCSPLHLYIIFLFLKQNLCDKMKMCVFC